MQVTASNSSGSASATSIGLAIPDSAGPPPSGQPTPPTTTPTITPPPLKASTASVGAVKVRGTSVVLSLACSQGSGTCPKLSAQLSVVEHLRGGKLLAVSAKKNRTTTRRVVVGKASVQLAAGQTKKLSVRLNRTGRVLLKRFGKLRATLRVANGRKVLKTRGIGMTKS